VPRGRRGVVDACSSSETPSRRDPLRRLPVPARRLSQHPERAAEHPRGRRRTVRVPYSERPPRHDYRLTDKGRDLWPVLTAMRQWGDRHAAPSGPPLLVTHRSCGAVTEAVMVLQLVRQKPWSSRCRRGHGSRAHARRTRVQPGSDQPSSADQDSDPALLPGVGLGVDVLASGEERSASASTRMTTRVGAELERATG